MTDRPNILYLHSHDTGRYVQPYGEPVPMPNVQALADQGVLFRQAFCAAPTCSASRACLLTGQYGQTNGMLGLAHRGWSLRDYRHHIVNVLRGAGYTSTLIGEQHISKEPEVIGYDEVMKIPTTRVETVAPLAMEVLRRPRDRPLFLSVGFFETHREFLGPGSLRDVHYSKPPNNLPDTPEVRADVAAFKASARSLDHGVGMVLNQLDACGPGGGHADHLHDRSRHAVPGRQGDAVRPRPRRDADPARARAVPRRARASTRSSRTSTSTRPSASTSGSSARRSCKASRCCRCCASEVTSAREEIFAGSTWHAAYEPQRAIRTTRHKYIRRWGERLTPVLANTDDGPSKDLLIRNGWAEREIPKEQLYDLLFDPNEANNLASDPAHASVLAELRGRLEAWMRDTDDPLLAGHVDPPPGVDINLPDQLSASEPTTRIE